MPKIHSTPVAQVYKDTTVEVEENSEGQWVQVKVFNISGWMLKSNFKEQSSSPSSPRRTSRKPAPNSSMQVYEAPTRGRVSPKTKALELLPLEVVVN